jgi:hypothetical protein
MSHGGKLNHIRIIEGLAVAPQYRSAGVAGFMIGHADAFTSYKFGVCAHLWSRELYSAPYFSTALSTDLYGYTDTGRTLPDTGVTEIDWDQFEQLWISNSPHWPSRLSDQPMIVATKPQNRRRTHRVFTGHGGVAVVATTERIGITPGAAAVAAAATKPIYEIVWSGKLSEEGLLPAGNDFDFTQLVNGIAAMLPFGGVLFGTTAPNGGGLRTANPEWKIGRSGVQAMYIYNYMPPAFGSCRIHMIRSEI